MLGDNVDCKFLAEAGFTFIWLWQENDGYFTNVLSANVQ